MGWGCCYCEVLLEGRGGGGGGGHFGEMVDWVGLDCWLERRFFFLGGSWGLANGGWVGLGYLSGMGRCVVDGGKVRLMFFSFFLMDIQVLYVVVLGRLGERE